MAINRCNYDKSYGRRRGAVLLEAILALPLLIAVLMAVVEFGLLTSNLGPLKQASRAGADVARQIALPLAGGVPPEVVAAVDQVLAEKGMSAEQIRLEHNVGAAGPYVLITGSGSCPSPSAPRPNGRQYVRLSVCVENTELAPNLLRTYGFDLAGRFSQQTTTRCYP